MHVIRMPLIPRIRASPLFASWWRSLRLFGAMALLPKSNNMLLLIILILEGLPSYSSQIHTSPNYCYYYYYCVLLLFSWFGLNFRWWMGWLICLLFHYICNQIECYIISMPLGDMVFFLIHTLQFFMFIFHPSQIFVNFGIKMQVN